MSMTIGDLYEYLSTSDGWQPGWGDYTYWDGKSWVFTSYSPPLNILHFTRSEFQKYCSTPLNQQVEPVHDPVNHPKHYTGHPSGIECIQITEHMGFNLGNATKYIWRCDQKLDAIEDLKKARWYIDREINKRESNNE